MLNQSAIMWSGMFLFAKILLIVNVIFGSCLTVVLIWFLIRNLRRRRTSRSSDLVWLSFSISNVMLLLVQVTDIVSFHQGKLAFHNIKMGCNYLGFVYTFLGFSDITHLTSVAALGLLGMKKPFMYRKLNKSRKQMCFVIVFDWLYALFWSGLPLFGWTSYVLQPDGIICSLDWTSTRLSNRLYVVALLLFCFTSPLLVLCFFFVMIQRGGGSTRSKEDKNVQYMSMIMLLTFMICWTPYAILGILMVAGYQPIPVEVLIVTCLFAKCSPSANVVVMLTSSYMRTRLSRGLSRKGSTISTLFMDSIRQFPHMPSGLARTESVGVTRTESDVVANNNVISRLER